MPVVRRRPPDGNTLGVSSGGASYLLEYSVERGLQATPQDGRSPPASLAVEDAAVFFWVLDMYALDRHLQFNWARVWAFSMVMLQFVAFLLLQFEEGGVTDGNGVMRYISDNIADHRGVGSVMVLAFAGSYLLLALFSMPPFASVVLLLLIFSTAGGGAGVVLFHDKHDVEHLISAALFIVGGLVLHILVIWKGPRRFLHVARDTILVSCAVVAAVVFLSVMLYCREKVRRDKKMSGRDPKLLTLWWVSGIAEYMLYINCCMLNAFVGQRLAEHTCFCIFEALPRLCREKGHA